MAEAAIPVRNWIGALALIVGGVFVQPVHAENREVPASAGQIRPLLVGMQIPEVGVRDLDGKRVNLKTEALKRPTVIVFYRGGWCPYCNTQLKELKDAEGALIKAGYQILAVSADKPEGLHKTLEKHSLSYRLLSDNHLDAARAFGIAFHVDDAMLEKYKGFGIDLEKASGEKHHLLPVPAVFLVGKDGEIKFEYVSPNYKVRLKAEVLLAAARAFSEEHSK